MPAPTAAVHVLGIRHHGPGSARSVAEALAALRPARVLVEGAPELTAVVELLGDPGMVPPVAGLVHALDDPRRAAFYPFAEFSPEWVAVRWALVNGVPVEFIDLPLAHVLAPAPTAAAGEDAEDEEDLEAPTPPTGGTRTPRPDPLVVLATAAGYDDAERWWEDAVEQRHDSPVARFEAVREAMAEVRAGLGESARDDEENELREAAMRQQIRAALKQHTEDEEVVVVCGAWHAPALHLPDFPPATHDQRRLRGLPKVKVGAAWAPWTSARLAHSSGYGAGVTAPGWYQHLFRHWRDAPDPVPDRARVPDDRASVETTWLVRVARALRTEQVAASTASVVEASRLASSLAALRGRPTPGLDELDDATLAVLTEGGTAPLDLVHHRLTVGREMGRVPDHAPIVPLAADLTRQAKSLRLKQSTTEQTIQLDLRKESQLARSVLLHRLALLGIDWGVEAWTGRTGGTFKETWELTWRPEFVIDLVEASRYGSTVETAAATRVGEQAAAATRLDVLAGLLDRSMTADLPVEAVLVRLSEAAAAQHDVEALLASVEPLARTCRYGNVRGIDTGLVVQVLDTLVRRACVGLPMACAPMNDEAAGSMRHVLDRAQRGLELLDDATGRELVGVWRTVLGELAEHDQQPGAVAGRAARILLDAGVWDSGRAAVVMGRRLSTAAPALQAAAWLDAFVAGQAALLVHDDALLDLVDQWVSAVPEQFFEDLLPLLRRTFSGFQPPERRQIGEKLSRGAQVRDAGPVDLLDLGQATPALRATLRLLGVPHG